MRKLISSGSPFEPRIGISRAVRVGSLVTVSATAPLGPNGRTVGRGDPEAQTRRCFEISHNPVKDAEQIIGASVFAQDITERKYADQMLRENEEWLRLAFDAGDLGRWRYFVATGMLHFDERARSLRLKRNRSQSGRSANARPRAFARSIRRLREVPG